jgi:RND family efflux transporter MFP subunit
LAKSQVALQAPRRVRVAAVKAGDATYDLTLPGTSSPFHSAVLYGKATGFVRKNLVDVGDHVKSGQLLAVIDAPETAEEIRLAQARVEEAEANVGLAQATADRNAKLIAKGVVSQQQMDDTQALANSAVAAVATRKADLQRLQVLNGYQQIVAPFDGVITRRGTDPGALVGGPGRALFEVAAVDTLRVYVDVPDAYASEVKANLDAKVFSPRDPAKTVTGKVVRTSGVLEESSRTLRAEVNIPGNGPVLPGAFVYVRFAVPRAKPAPSIPASALLVRKEGTLVARIAASNGGEPRLELKKVTLGRDFGKEIEILDGIAPGDQVVVNAADDLENGQQVEPLPLAAK